MKYEKFGRTGLKLSEVILGTMNFGPLTSASDSFEIMDRALELGINHFDTANTYGGDGHAGRSEAIIGDWFQQSGNRNKVFLTSKVTADMGDQLGQLGINALNIRRSCEASLRRLKTDYIDLYTLHHLDRLVQPEEWMQAMEQLVREGKILYAGSSNFAGWTIAQAMEMQKRRSFLGLVAEQHVYNLHNRAAELEVIPACKAYGLAFTVYSPLAGGLLAGQLSGRTSGRRGTWLGEQDAATQESVRQYEAHCAKIGHEPALVAQAWLLQNPAVAAVISGPRTMEQLEDAVAATGVYLKPEDIETIEACFRTIKGAAPESYAW